MRKILLLLSLFSFAFLLAFVPYPSQAQTTAVAVTPTIPPPEIPPNLEGLSIWCLPQGVSYVHDLSKLEKSEQAVEVSYTQDGFMLVGPLSACFLQLPAAAAADGMQVAIFDQSNSAAWYTRPLVAGTQGWIAPLTHSYLVNPPYWSLNYRLQLQNASGETVFSAPLHYERNWLAERCWNGNLPNPITLRCPLQQDLHPWDAGYGKPLPTLKP